MEPDAFDPKRAQHAMRRGILSIGFVLILVAVVLVGVYRSDLGAEAIRDLQNASNPVLLLASWLIISFAFYFMGLRWRALMPPPHRPPSLGLASIICAGLLLNYAVPGPFGELGAAWFAHKRYRLPLSDALATGVAARLIGLATASMLALLIWATMTLPPPTENGEVLQMANDLIPVAAVFIGIGGALLFLLALRPGWWRALSSVLFGRWTGPGKLSRSARRLDQAVASLADALSRTASRGFPAYARTVGWSIAGHVSVIAGIYVATLGLGANPSLAGLSFTYAATTASAVALFAFPGSQFGWDLMFFSLLVAAAGLSAPVAGAIAVFVRLQQISMMMLGAITLSWLIQVTSSHSDPE